MDLLVAGFGGPVGGGGCKGYAINRSMAQGAGVGILSNKRGQPPSHAGRGSRSVLGRQNASSPGSGGGSLAGRKYAKIGYTNGLPTLPIQQYPSAPTQSKGDKPMSDDRSVTPAPGSEAPEQPVLLIPLALDITDAEISGLAWAGDELIILPQYPNWQKTPGDGMVMALSKAEI